MPRGRALKYPRYQTTEKTTFDGLTPAFNVSEYRREVVPVFIELAEKGKRAGQVDLYHVYAAELKQFNDGPHVHRLFTTAIGTDPYHDELDDPVFLSEADAHVYLLRVLGKSTKNWREHIEQRERSLERDRESLSTVLRAMADTTKWLMKAGIITADAMKDVATRE